MKVSIITPTWNSARFLQDCINSVRWQANADIEYIIVDAKSTDDTLAIIMRNSDVVTRYISESDRGMYDAINKGITLATGDIIGVLNSDDVFATEDVIETIVKTFHDTNCDSVYGDLNFVDAENINKVTRKWKSGEYQRKLFHSGWMPPHPTFYLKRSLIEKYGNYENHFYSAADYEFMCRYLYKYGISACYIPKLLIKMRRGGQSNGSLKKRLRANRRDYLAMKKNGIPFPFLVSILKPLSKLHQYRPTNKDKF